MSKQLKVGIGNEATDLTSLLPLPGEEPEGNEEFLAYYKDLYEEAKKLKEEQVDTDEWETSRDAYNNVYSDGNLTVNQVYANGKVIVGSSSFRRPRVLLVPHNEPRLWFYSKVLERVTNWIIERIKLGKVTETCCLDTYLYGRTFVKFGFSSEWDATSGRGGDRKLEYSELVKKGEPWARRVDPIDVDILGEADFSRVRYVFYRIHRSYEDLLSDKRLNKKVLEKLSSEGENENFDRNEDIELVEVWDKKRKTWALFHEDLDEFVKEPKTFSWFPWVSMAWNEDGTNFWCASDVSQFWSQQLEINRTREQLRRHSLICLLKILVKQNMLDEDEIKNFLSNEIGVIVQVKGDLKESIQQLTPQIPNELFLMLKRCDEDIRMILGHNLNILGEYVQKSRVTAEETQRVGAGSELRLSERRNNVMGFLEEIIRGIHQVILLGWKDNKGGQQTIVSNPTGERQIVTWGMADLKDVVDDVELSLEDRVVETKQSEKGEIGEMVKFIQQTGGLDPTTLAKLTSEYFARKPSTSPPVQPTQQPEQPTQPTMPPAPQI